MVFIVGYLVDLKQFLNSFVHVLLDEHLVPQIYGFEDVAFSRVFNLSKLTGCIDHLTHKFDLPVIHLHRHN